MEERGDDGEQGQEAADVAGQPPADRSRRGAWLLFVLIVVGAGIAGFFTPRLLPHSDDRTQSADKPPPQLRAEPVERGIATQPPTPAEKPTSPAPQSRSGTEAALAGPAADAAPPPQSVEELIEEVKQVAGQVVDAFPDNADALEMMARVQSYLGNSARAVKAWQRCLELDPGYAYAYFGLASVATKEGDYKKAVDLLRQGLALAPGGYKPVYQLADGLMKLGRMDEAIAVLVKHVQTDPQAAWSHYLLGQAYLQMRQYEQAKQSYELALKIHQQQTDAQAGSAAPDEPRPRGKQYREYVQELDRMRNSALYGLANACARLGEKEKSQAYMEQFRKHRAVEKAAHFDPRNKYDDLKTMCLDFALTFTHIGRVYFAQGNLEQAERLWRKAATLDAENTECRAQLLSLFQQTNRPGQALQICEQLTKLEPGNAMWYLNLGLIHARANRFLAAEEAFQKASEVAPHKSWGYHELAQLYLASNRKLPEAKRLAREAVKIEPVAQNYFILSRACDRNGDPAGALAAIKRAVELEPNNAAFRQIQQILQAKN